MSTQCYFILFLQAKEQNIRVLILFLRPHNIFICKTKAAVVKKIVLLDQREEHMLAGH